MQCEVMLLGKDGAVGEGGMGWSGGWDSVSRSCVAWMCCCVRCETTQEVPQWIHHRTVADTPIQRENTKRDLDILVTQLMSSFLPFFFFTIHSLRSEKAQICRGKCQNFWVTRISEASLKDLLMQVATVFTTDGIKAQHWTESTYICVYIKKLFPSFS